MGNKEKTHKSTTSKGMTKNAARVAGSATAPKVIDKPTMGEAPPNAAGSVTASHPRVIMSAAELAQLGGGILAYIKVMTHDQAKAMFPGIEELPTGINLYALHAADGTPLALTDSRSGAIGQAMGNELAIASLH